MAAGFRERFAWPRVGRQPEKANETAHERRSPALVVAALTPMLRWQPGRNPVDNDGATRHLSGLGFRALAFLRRAYGGHVRLAPLP
jgi:hypothetical protein